MKPEEWEILWRFSITTTVGWSSINNIIEHLGIDCFFKKLQEAKKRVGHSAHGISRHVDSEAVCDLAKA